MFGIGSFLRSASPGSFGATSGAGRGLLGRTAGAAGSLAQGMFGSVAGALNHLTGRRGTGAAQRHARADRPPMDLTSTFAGLMNSAMALTRRPGT
jgi:hypothetical protein